MATTTKPKPKRTLAKRSLKPKSKSSRPQPSTLKLESASVADNRWECPHCRESNHPSAPSCGACMQERPGLDDRESMLCFILEPHDEAQGYWDELRTLGATDAKIYERVQAVLEDQSPVEHARTDRGFICWQLGVDGLCRVWFGEHEPPQRKPDLDCDGLIAAVRELYGIEKTVSTKAREPWTPGELAYLGRETDDEKVAALCHRTVADVAATRAERQAANLFPYGKDLEPAHPSNSPLSTEHTGMLRSILEPDRMSAGAWLELKGVPTDDDRLTRLIHEVLVNRPNRESTLFGPVCWVTGPLQPDIGSIAVWFDDAEPETRTADLMGAALLEAVRELYGIPAAARKPKAESGTPKATRKTAKQNGSIRKAEPPAAEPPAAGALSSQPSALSPNSPTVRNLDPAAIDRFPLNPRDEAEFDEATLKELGAELKRRQVQSCVVREVAGPDGVKRFQLIAGERRWRAAKLVGLAELRCEIVDVDDAEAIWMCGAENESRQNWSPIAQARWYVELKKAEGLTDRQLAKRVGRSQPVVTSAMNLLSLPEAWRTRLISREISPTVARPLLPWANKRPQVLEKVDSLLKLDKRDAGAEPLTVRKVEEAIRDAIAACTKSMNPQDWRAGKPLFGITKKRKAELDCEKLRVEHWNGAPAVLRAWNVTRWNELQKEAKARLQKQAKAEAANGEGAPSSGTLRTNPPGGSPATTQTHNLELTIDDLLKGLFADAWSKNASRDLNLRVYLLVAGEIDQDVIEAISDRPGRGRWMEWGTLRTITVERFFEVVPQAIEKLFRDDHGWMFDCLRDARAEIAAELKIDLAAAWQPTRAQLECFCLDDLRKFKGLPKGERTAKKLSKAELIDHFLEHWPAGWMPPAVRKILGVKNKPAKKK